jgi:succinate dehydrogenase / fumarate reductase cytochrome b subunit
MSNPSDKRRRESIGAADDLERWFGGDFVPTETFRPIAPNIQVYRPQLTSVLSIANRVTGVALGLGALGLVAWLIAAASGPHLFLIAQNIVFSWPGEIFLIGLTFAFFLHFLGGVRHLVWDTVRGFELRSIYASGWAVVITSIILTAATWVFALRGG